MISLFTSPMGILGMQYVRLVSLARIITPVTATFTIQITKAFGATTRLRKWLKTGVATVGLMNRGMSINILLGDLVNLMSSYEKAKVISIQIRPHTTKEKVWDSLRNLYFSIDQPL